MDSTFLTNLRNNLKPNSETCPKLEGRLTDHRKLHHPELEGRLTDHRKLHHPKLEERLTDHRKLHHPKLAPFDRRGQYQVPEHWRVASAHNLCDDGANNQVCSCGPSSRPSKIDAESFHGRINFWEKLKAMESSVEVKTRLVRRCESCWDDEKCSKPIIFKNRGEQECTIDVDVDSKHVLHGTATFIKIGRQDAVSQSKEQQPYGIDLEYKENPKIINTKTDNSLKDAHKSLENNIRSKILDDFIGNISLNSMTHNAKTRNALNGEYDIHDAQETEITNNMQELAENTIHCNKNITKYQHEYILSPSLSKDNCASTYKDAYIDELENKPDIWKSYTKKIENEILKWFYLVPVNPSEKSSRKYQRNKLVRNLIENVIELSNNIDDKDFKENVKFVIYLCLDSLPIWHPGYETEISELKHQFANVLLNKILDISKMLRHKDSKHVNTLSTKENFHENAIDHHNNTHKVFKEDVKKQIIAEMITTLEEMQRKVNNDVYKYLTNSLIANLGACIDGKVSTGNIHKIRLFLVERLCTIFYDLPVVLFCPKNGIIDLHQLAEDVADSFLGIENTQHKRNTVKFITEVKSIQTVPIFKKTVESLAYLPSPKSSGNILIYRTKSGNLSTKSMQDQARAKSLPSLIDATNKNAKKSEEEATSNLNALKINGENLLETTPLKNLVIGNKHVGNLKGPETNDTATIKLSVEKLERSASLTSLSISSRDAENNKEAARSQHTTSFHSLNIAQSPAVDCKRSHAPCQHVKWCERERSTDNQTTSCPEEKVAERYLILVVNEYLKQYEDAEDLIAKEAIVTRLLLEFEKINLQTRRDVYNKLKKGAVLPTPICVERFRNELVTLKAVFKWFGRLELSKTILQHPQKQIFVRNFANQIDLLRTQVDIKTNCFENKLLQTVESFLETISAKVCKTNIKYIKNALINRLIEEIHSEEARKHRPPCCKVEDTYKIGESTCPHLVTEEDLAKQFTDLVIDTNYNIGVCDKMTREALIRKLVIEIRKITGSKLTKQDVYSTLKKIHQPIVFDLDWFKRDLIYISNIAQWLYSLPAAPVTIVEEKKRRFEHICDLANFFNNLQLKINKGDICKCNFLPDLTVYVAKWLDQVLMPGYAPSYEVFIYQLLKIMNIRKLDSVDEHSTLDHGSLRKHSSIEETTDGMFTEPVPLSSSLRGSPTGCRRNRLVPPGILSAGNCKSNRQPSFLKSASPVRFFEASDIHEQSTQQIRPASFRYSKSLEDYLNKGSKHRQTLHDLHSFLKKEKNTSKRTMEDEIMDKKCKTRKCGCLDINKEEIKRMLKDMPCVLMSPMLCYFPIL